MKKGDNTGLRWEIAVLKGLPLVVLSAMIGVSIARIACDGLGSGAEAEAVAGDDSAASTSRRRICDVGDSASARERRPRYGWIEDARPGSIRAKARQVTSVGEDGTLDMEDVDECEAQRGFHRMMGRLRIWGKAPLSERYAVMTSRPFDSSEAKESKVHVGDIFISGLPMIDQGINAFCAVASAARVLQGYGIEVTMEDMAVLAKSSPTAGTSMISWEDAIRTVAQEHGLTLQVIPDLTESMTPLGTLIQNYNHTADKVGGSNLNPSHYVENNVQNYAAYDQDREYKVQREVMLTNLRAGDAFEENIGTCIDNSDPLFWCVKLGDVKEEATYFDAAQQRGVNKAHMRLIIGYNERDGEVLYTDSWGPGHELKRMNADDALSITTGMYYLKGASDR